jgi:cytochrome P450
MTAPADFGAAYDELFAQRGRADPHPLYRAARHDAPIFWSRAADAWVVTRHATVRRLLEDEATFAVLSGGAGASIHGRTILQMSGEEHRRKKAIIARGIRSTRLLTGPIAADVEAISAGLLERLAAESGPVDLKANYTTPLPLQVIARLLDVAVAADFREWYEALAAAGVENVVADPGLREAGLAARDELRSLVGPMIEQRRSAPGDDLISTLATAEFEGERLSDEEIKALVGFLLTAGVETTDRVLASLFHRLLSHPAEWSEVTHGGEDATVAASAEILRLEPPVQALPRRTLVDTELHDTPLPAGTRLIGVIASANRDEEVFAEGDRFVLNRFANPDREFTPAGATLPFGAGSHHCTGSLLAKLEMQVAIRDITTNFGAMQPAGPLPPPVGVMLRSPAALPVRLAR